MSQERQKLIHLHRGSAGAPSASTLNLGEIAINHSTEKPAIYLKDNDSHVIEFLPASAIQYTTQVYADGLIEALEATGLTIASNNDGVVSIYPTLNETGGVVEITGTAINLAKVATTGKASDVEITDSDSAFTATTVEGALSELNTKINGVSQTTIDSQSGNILTGDGLNDVTSENKTISVKTKTNDYVKVDGDGIQIDSTKVDSGYETSATTNLATVGTVQSAINGLDVNGFGLLEVISSASNISEFIVKGVKQVDGKIETDSPTNDYAIMVDGQYNNSTNKLATESTVKTAIEGLDVSAVTGTSSQTITSISETDGKISVEYSPISISKSQITDLEDLSDTYALKSTVDDLIGSDSGKTVREIANEELATQLIPEGASASLDTLQEIAAWIQDHPADASEMNLKISNLEDSAHTHDNKSILDGISAAQITNWDTAYDNYHTHTNKSDLDNITGEKITSWDNAAESAHTHDNKALLDTYTQTESDLADAVSKKHEHTNASVLNDITSADTENWDTAYTNTHTHDNKSLLDAISATQITNWDDAASKSHEHDNKSVLDGISATQVTNWDTAYANTHTHDNIDVLTGLTSEDITKWNGAATAISGTVTGATGDTYVSASVSNQVVTVEATQTTKDKIDGAVQGVNTTSTSTSANVTVDSTTKLLDFSNMTIDCGEY